MRELRLFLRAERGRHHGRRMRSLADRGRLDRRRRDRYPGCFSRKRDIELCLPGGFDEIRGTVCRRVFPEDDNYQVKAILAWGSYRTERSRSQVQDLV